jgi:alginate O-acetyltransferase complex protein AlgI
VHFYSLFILLFVSFFLILNYTIFRHKQWVCLLGASLLFYCLFSGWHLVFVLITSFTVWLGGRQIARARADYDKARKAEGVTRDQKKALKAEMTHKKRIALFITLAVNVGILVVFKCWKLFGSIISDNGTINIILPLGISFYTFQATSYLIDMYYEKYDHEPNYLHFLLFVSWFPQMVQGPINRYDKMQPQLFASRMLTADAAKRALLLFLFGAMKKYAIGDPLASTVGVVFDHGVDDLSSAAILYGMLIFLIQEYADFSGGIDMISAISLLFGVQLAQNFRQPYFATSMGDFWRRWHITLGAWMRDYVFYPFAVTQPMMQVTKWGSAHLGHTLGRVLPAALGNIVVFLLVGIWHGTGWNFVFWGLYNGLLIAASDLAKPTIFKKLFEITKVDPKGQFMHVVRIIRTFCLVGGGVLFERVAHLPDCFRCFYNLVAHWGGWGDISIIFQEEMLKDSPLVPIVCFTALALVFICSVMRENGLDMYVWLHDRVIVVRWAIYFLMIILTLASFIYAGQGGGFLYANY